MKRRLFLIGSSYFISLIVACAVKFSFSIIIFSFLCLSVVIMLIVKKLRQNHLILTALTVSILAFAAFNVYTYIEVLPVKNLDGIDAQISATLCELPEESEGKYTYTLKTDSIEAENAKQNIKLKVNTNNPIDIDVYDKIKARVHFYLPSDDVGLFSTVTYQNSKGIYISAYMYEYEDYEITKAKSYPLYYHALNLRQKISDSINATLPSSEAALVNAVILGMKQSLDNTISENLRISGVSHLMSVSGLHMAIISQFIMAFFLFLNLPKRFSAFLTILFVAAFMAITGFLPSVMRAGIMCIIFYLGIVFRRQADSLNSLGIAVLVLSVVNPLSGGDLGLILSFFATLALLVLSPKLNYFLQQKTKNLRQNKISNKFISSINTVLSTTISATIFTLPFTITAFSEVSLVSIIGNLLMVYPASLMMLLAMVCSIANLFGIFSVTLPVCLCVYLLAKYIILVSALIAKIPFACISTSHGFILLWLCFTMLLIAFSFLWNHQRYFSRILCIYSVIILLCGIASYQISNHTYAQLSILSCGNNTAVTVSNDGYHCVLSCGGTVGNSSKIISKLKSQYVNKLTALIVPDAKNTSCATAGSIIEKYNPEYILMNKNIKQTESVMTAVSSSDSSQNINYFAQQGYLKMTDSVQVKVIQSNKNKSFVKADINGFKIIICPSGGDVEDIPQNERQCDFFIMSKVPRNVQEISTTYTVLSMYEDEAMKTIKYAKIPKTSYILKTSEGDIQLKLKQDKTAKISVAI